jgi:hypothetical protein
MAPVLHHALLGASVAALGAAGVRAASPLAPAGLARVLVAAVFATAAAVAEAILLGLLALGGSPVALALAALATWLAGRHFLPRPATSPVGELVAWWRGRSALGRAAAGGLAGAAAAWIAWQLLHPALGYDAVHYHVPEMVLWVQQGTPGSAELVLPGLPVGNYPLTTEVTVAWAMGLARSFVPIVLWPWITFGLTVAAGWVGLRALLVPRAAAAAAVAALCSVPWVLAWQSNGSITDPPALAWLVVCAALCALARERPVLLAPALLAAALSIGTKTTVIPMAAVVLATALWSSRSRLRALARPLAFATLAGLVVGGGWYLRNLVDHGSPFWPIVATPWGDPVPASVNTVSTSFMSRPGATVDGLGTLYSHKFGGGWLLLLAGVLAPLAAPRRRVLAAAAVAAGGFLVWTLSPVTGLPPDGTFPETIFSTTRYLLPVLAAAALALALGAAHAGRKRSRALVAVAVALAAVNAYALFHYYGFPSVPSARTPLAGAVAGAIVAFALGRLEPPRLARVPAPITVLVAVAAGALLAVPAAGFLRRHADTRAVPEWPIERHLASDAAFRATGTPLAITPSYLGPLAGDRLRHRLTRIGAGESCSRIVERTGSEWLVVYGGGLGGQAVLDATRCLASRAPAFREGPNLIFKPPGGRP